LLLFTIETPKRHCRCNHARVLPTRGVTTWGQEEQFPGRRIANGGAQSLRGRWKITKLSQVLSSIQYICFRKISGSNMGAPNLLLAPGPI